ncbi:flagellar hook-associated protein FlgK [Anoxybacillus flavithermus]|uniref:Flagellar hook-associated protein 1 n=1 Tax=Anoxybacillus flavithermus AK1 TaxID=1297581 RepID=M8CWJ5_9BACL|nr:flagellar hook-associated protein FlgK [Anoxybacillus flavithermus]EMT45888.1 flagellar hook-associated protein FlgK [Anoxybacillus flavithermus AK1]
MLSTFHGLETVRRGMTAQQQALYVTGHNIANANTPGYSRQRVNFEQTPPYPFASKNRPVIPGQMGTGVEGGTVQRMREEFLDVQYRGENMKYGYWNTRAEALYKMEEIMNEPSDEGLAKTLDRFWQALQDLAVNPSNSGARSVVRQRGIAVAETFHYLSSSLKSIREDLRNELDVTIKAVNSLARQLSAINKQISEVEVHGYLPNDLYDERNRLLDELSQYVNIKVTPVSSGGSALKIAEGSFTVELVDRNGTSLGKLVDGNTGAFNEITVKYETTGDKYVSEIKLGNDSLNFLSFKENGKIGALLHSYGYGGGTGLYPEMLNNLNAMARAFADEFNKIHSTGWSIYEIQKGQKLASNDFFKYDLPDVAGTLNIHPDIMESLDRIAASAAGFGMAVSGTFNGSVTDGTSTWSSISKIRLEITYVDDTSGKKFEYKIWDVSNPSSPSSLFSGEASLATGTDPAANLKSALQSSIGSSLTFITHFTTLKQGDKWTFEFEEGKPIVAQIGDGSNAQALAEVKNGMMNIAGNTTTIQNFYESLIGQMAVNAQEAKRLSQNSEVLRQSVDERRMAVSSVSLDEEMMNMMKFQHAYNASARMITMIDQMLDKIINNMGLVGR